MSYAQVLKEEIESSLGPGQHARGTTILRSVTDLFLHHAGNYSDEQVEVFDDVMQCLLDHSGHDAKLELSGRLAGAPRVPANLVRTLLKDSDPAVSLPLLAQSPSVSDEDLAQFVKNGSAEQAMMVARRPAVTKFVSDALFARKTMAITYAVLANTGAEVSESSFVTLIGDCSEDAQLCDLLAAREDFPEELRPFLEAYSQEAKAQDTRRRARS